MKYLLLVLLISCHSSNWETEVSEVVTVSQCVAVGNGWDNGYIQCGVRLANGKNVTVNYVAQLGDLIEVKTCVKGCDRQYEILKKVGNK